ncbi:MAG: hypothetical protein ABSH29_19285 [Acidimicrobiales bacterium]
MGSPLPYGATARGSSPFEDVPVVVVVVDVPVVVVVVVPVDDWHVMEPQFAALP